MPSRIGEGDGKKGMRKLPLSRVRMTWDPMVCERSLTHPSTHAHTRTRHSDFAGSRERYAGTEFSVTEPLDKAKIEIECPRSQVSYVTRLVASAAYTGEIGDGKVGVLNHLTQAAVWLGAM